MREAWHLLVAERRARAFFTALGQSSLGTGAAYVALLLIAYDRWRSPWAITLVLLADLVPAMFLGPVFGAASDRWSRKTCAIVADVLRFVAFVGIGLVDSFALTIVLALLAGCGTALFTPATLASLPGLVAPERLPAATAVYGAMADVGLIAGPSLAAVVLLVAPPETLLLANGVTFGLSALLLAQIRFGAVPERVDQGRMSLVGEARAGVAATAGMPGIRFLLCATAVALFFAGAFNVAELPFAVDVLASGDVGYSILAACFGIGLLAGSLLGAAGGPLKFLKRRFLTGVLVLGIGFGASGAAPVYFSAAAAFILAGLGNGAMLVYERLLIQASVPDAVAGRVFGMKDALTAWAFGLAFIFSGGLLELVGPRVLIGGLGACCVAVAAVSAYALRDAFEQSLEASGTAPALGAGAGGDRLAG